MYEVPLNSHSAECQNIGVYRVSVTEVFQEEVMLQLSVKNNQKHKEIKP